MANGGMFSGINSGMLGLEMSPQQQYQQHLQPQQNPQNPNLSQQNSHTHHTMVSFGQNEVDHHHTQNQQNVKQGYPFNTKPRTQQLAFSDDDEPGVGAEDSGGQRNASPWQRMKWTDAMVKLLITMVFYIGDDQAGSEGNDVGKKKGGGGSGGGALQKKGKWKSVSKAMMERGFFVSPQQCEDKFNDLNKRYKRVNDILGRGTSCKVVENQSLLDTMDHLSPKMKEEVRKLLNSKHLFFREMCAYHNSCNGGAQHSAEAGADSSHIQQQQQQRRACLHSSDNSPNVHNVGRTETEGSKMMKGVSVEEEDDDEDDNDDEDDDNDEVEGGARGHEHESDHDVRTSSHKRTRNEMYASDSTSFQEFSNELKFVVQDSTKSSWEKRQWMRIRLMQLEEQRMNHQCQAFDLEKQKMKWSKFRHKKERDMEAERLANERMRLQNERMVLMLRQKELELLDFSTTKSVM
ncbi:transcriptional regulator EFH1 [Heracleum sosnowskyi]|uniref:Transcriptional regulator EFH1 n=1 Tax=Heracleum sosnowskyi TaxID=360622 RepID=A0AAD8N8T5_9APIA|nr:transcriptional regulator EFH1 [Heracleum sosnowskyi]